MSRLWVGSDTLAEIAGISSRAVRKRLAAIARATQAEWHGATLVVRKVHGCRGRSGVRYEVRADSLPFELQERLKALLPPL